jgi:hypothetical protein
MTESTPADKIIKCFERFRNNLENSTEISLKSFNSYTKFSITISDHFYGYIYGLTELTSFLDWVFNYLPVLNSIKYSFIPTTNFIPDNTKITKLKLFDHKCLDNITLYQHINILEFTNITLYNIRDICNKLNNLETIEIVCLEMYKKDIDDIIDIIQSCSNYSVEGRLKVQGIYSHLIRLKCRKNTFLVKSAGKL